ncbi:MAG: hypothetical protein GF317_00235 [Candidatus Lokiarchaeota archaeon]|nr:hypothetical protein [Candidatus Lokiarchaeota archaeon]MBD3198410.1 hypothetical protein [Candidatus Lokiarchaeota archaeon]
MVILINYKVTLVKIGGSILDSEDNTNSTISQLRYLAEYGKTNSKFIIIPGGGKYALFLRYLDKKLGLGDDLSHWEAIYSMDYNGLELKEKYKSIQITSDFNKLMEFKDGCVKDAKITLFLPYDYLQQEDELPHTWDVTSDSIAIYLAHRLQLEECYLIKDVDGILDKQGNLIREINSHKFESLRDTHGLQLFKKKVSIIKTSTPMDAYSLNLINTYKIRCILLNGSHNKSGLKSYFQNPSNPSTKYTRIIPSNL